MDLSMCQLVNEWEKQVCIDFHGRSFLLAYLSNASLDHDRSSFLWSPLSLSLSLPLILLQKGVLMVSCRGAICADATVLQGKERGKALGIIGRVSSLPTGSVAP